MIYKYIITRDGPIIFSEKMSHYNVGHGLSKIYSAGVCKIIFDGQIKVVEVWGESQTLKKHSHPDKDILVLNCFYIEDNAIKIGYLSIAELYVSGNNRNFHLKFMSKL